MARTGCNGFMHCEASFSSIEASGIPAQNIEVATHHLRSLSFSVLGVIKTVKLLLPRYSHNYQRLNGSFNSSKVC